MVGMWSIRGSLLTSASVPLSSTFDLTSERDSKCNNFFFPHLDSMLCVLMGQAGNKMKMRTWIVAYDKADVWNEGWL